MTTADLPISLDYSAHYEIEIPPNEPYDTGFVHHWEDALLYDTGDVREFLVKGGLYHQRITDTFLVGYNFQFEIDEKDRIVANGVVHPATQHREDYHTDESVIMSKAIIVIKPIEPDATQELRRYIRVNCMNQLPEVTRGFGMPASQRCRRCSEQGADPDDPVSRGVPPIMECPACGDTFCDSCTDIDAWLQNPIPRCPNCGHLPMEA